MKLGIMQPYFFPYIGYWQLMNAVDTYVIYDDVNYINRGWINRNRILINGKPSYINLPLVGASHTKLINQISVDSNPKLIAKNLTTVHHAYAKAPYFHEVMPIIEEVLGCGIESLPEYLQNSFRIVGEYLGITTNLIMSSSLKKDCSLRGQDKIVDICMLLQATEYYNAIGGIELYLPEVFERYGIELSFLKTGDVEYPQYSQNKNGYGFQPNLSIIDVMMFNSPDTINEMLDNYMMITK